MKKYFTAAFLLCFLSLAAAAQGTGSDSLHFDRKVHDFGKIDMRDGAVSCTFTLSNDSSSTVNILSVNTTCSCTTAKWTRSDIPAGGSGTVEVTYSNDEGAQHFDKAIYVYLTGCVKPVVLHIRGTSFKGKKDKR